MTGMSFCSPDSNPTARNNDAFVDDTTGGVNDLTHTPLSPIDLATLLHKQTPALGTSPLRVGVKTSNASTT
jgi:hypothetical protein